MTGSRSQPARARAQAHPRTRTPPVAPPWRLVAAIVLACLACGSPAGDADAPAPEPATASAEETGAAPASPPAATMPALPDAALPQLHMDWPVEIVHITSDFGWRVDPVSGQGTRLHGGVDLRGAIGDLVLAVAPGTVVFAGHDALLGTHVIIDHGQAIQSFYGHLSGLLVHEGLPVERGAAIGLVGNSGRSAAPHLHLTIKVQGVPVDPIAMIGHPLHAPTAVSARKPEPPPPESGSTSGAVGAEAPHLDSSSTR